MTQSKLLFQYILKLLLDRLFAQNKAEYSLLLNMQHQLLKQLFIISTQKKISYINYKHYHL